METTTLAAATLDAMADEHELLANLYERILQAIQAGPGEFRPAATLLDELVERLREHFAHEEQGGYYSHVVEIAPWRAPTVDELERQHAHLLRTVMRIALGARMANESSLWCNAVREDFAEFLHLCADHEARENRLVQEVYLLDVAAAD